MFGSCQLAGAEPRGCCFLQRNVCLPDLPVNTDTASTPQASKEQKFVIKHINMPSVGQVTRVHIGRAVKQRMKFKNACSYLQASHCFYRINYFLVFLCGKGDRTAAQLSLRCPDHRPALLKGFR